MSRCECGQLAVPAGNDITVTFYEGVNSTSMTLAHKNSYMVLDENSLRTYGVAPASPSITPERISITLGSSPLYVNSVMLITFKINGKTIGVRYFGVKHDYWRITEVAGVPTLNLSCSSVTNNGIDVAGQKVEVELKSICDNSTGDCCSDTLGSIEMFSYRKNACGVKQETTTTPTPEIVFRYTQDCSTGNCREDVNGFYSSYLDCKEQLDCPSTTTTTTAAPTTTLPPPSTTTTTTTTTTLAP